MTVKIRRNHFYSPKKPKTLKNKLQQTKQLSTNKLIKKQTILFVFYHGKSYTRCIIFHDKYEIIKVL